MKIFLRILFVLCITSALIAAQEWQENISFSFDERDWEIGFQNSTDQSSIIEFRLKEETIENFSELVTVQVLPCHLTMTQYYKEMCQSLKNASQNRFGSKIIKSEPDSMLFEWWIDKGELAQHEWFRIIKKGNRAFILRYTTKKMDQIEKVRGVWEKKLQEAKLISTSELKNAGKFEPLKFDPKMAMHTFVDDDKTFSVVVPNNWELTVLKKSDDGTFIHIFCDPQTRSNIKFCVGKLEPAEKNLTTLQLLDEMVEVITSKFTSSKLIRIESFNFPSSSSIKSAVVGPACPFSGSQKTINFLVGIIPLDKDRYVHFNVGIETEQFEELLPIFKMIVASYKQLK